MAEMPLILIAAQRVLDVAGNGGVHIFVGAFLAGKGGGLVVVNAAEAHGAAVADILIDAVNAEDGFKLAVRDECGVQQDAAVVKLLVLGKKEAQRVRAESTIFMPQAANTSENSAAPSMKSSISVTSSRNT